MGFFKSPKGMLNKGRKDVSSVVNKVAPKNDPGRKLPGIQQSKPAPRPAGRMTPIQALGRAMGGPKPGARMTPQPVTQTKPMPVEDAPPMSSPMPPNYAEGGAVRKPSCRPANGAMKGHRHK